jgi:hypothetical protein
MYALCQHFSSASIIIIISLSSFFAPTFSAAFHINKSLRDVHPSGAKCAEIRNFVCKKEQEFFHKRFYFYVGCILLPSLQKMLQISCFARLAFKFLIILHGSSIALPGARKPLNKNYSTLN